MESELHKSTVYFDGSCPPCRAEIGYYSRKDQAALLCFVDVSESGAVIPEEITQKRAMERFHVRANDGRVLSGAAAFVEVWTRLPKWRWAARAASLPEALAALELDYGCFFRCDRSSPASLDESCSFSRLSTEQSAGDWAV